ncbi:hypothetical protein K456DRAFT_848677 [Colletotrichum gloeosporioides 23]|nr:hypothetical protein K456DRAFT_848677 [Colletotrichum gloeosporioides 23]
MRRSGRGRVALFLIHTHTWSSFLLGRKLFTKDERGKSGVLRETRSFFSLVAKHKNDDDYYYYYCFLRYPLSQLSLFSSSAYPSLRRA